MSKLYLCRPLPMATEAIGLEAGPWSGCSFKFRHLDGPNKGMLMTTGHIVGPGETLQHFNVTTSNGRIYVDHQDRKLPQWLHAADDAAAAFVLHLPVELVSVFYATDNLPPFWFWTLQEATPR